jgi:hypothetical protein
MGERCSGEAGALLKGYEPLSQSEAGGFRIAAAVSVFSLAAAATRLPERAVRDR